MNTANLILLPVVLGVTVVALCGHTAQAFSASSSSPRFAVPNTANLVEEALKISATFGLDSKEAAVAWDAVEEIESSTENREVSLPSLDQECEVEEVSAKCEDYGRFLDELVTLRDSMKKADGSSQKQSFAETLKFVQLVPPESAPVVSSDALTTALEAAKAATAASGIASVEARLAWETYEEIASSGLTNAVGVNLAEECSLDESAGMEACKAMEELQRVMPVLMALSTK